LSLGNVSLPSGLWIGHYEQFGKNLLVSLSGKNLLVSLSGKNLLVSLSGKKFPEQATLEFADGLVRGDGVDSIGVFYRLTSADSWSCRMRDTHRPSQAGNFGVGLGDVLDARSDGATARNWSGLSGGGGLPSSRVTLEEMRAKIQRYLRGDRGGEGSDASKPRVAKELQRVVFDLGTTRDRLGTRAA